MNANGNKMVPLLLQILICTSMLRDLNAIPCEGYFKNCCPGSSWNSKTQQCEKCMPGYIGVHCSSPCPYPYYGVDCQRTCNCSSDFCDVSSGCIRIVTVRGDCEPGYFGKNCRGKCTYPYYGEECQGQCDCGEDRCNVSTGCTNVTKVNIYCYDIKLQELFKQIQILRSIKK